MQKIKYYIDEYGEKGIVILGLLSIVLLASVL